VEIKDFSIFDILEKSGERKIVTWGAGRAFDSFCQMFKEYQFHKHVEFIIDIDEKKNNCKKIIMGKEIKIVKPSMGVFLKDIKWVIVITTQYLKDVMDMLETLCIGKDVEICFFGFVKDSYSSWKLKNGYMNCSIVNDGHEIPKLIHYCWFGRKPLPYDYKVWIKTWKKFCPDYEMIEWNEDNYDLSKSTYAMEAYERGMWAFVSDYVCLDVVYDYGGVYMDTDVEMIKSIEPLRHQIAFCGFQDEMSVALGLGFGSVKNNPIIREMRDDYDSINFILPSGRENLTSCAVYQTRVLSAHGMKMNGRFQKLEHINVYPKVFFSPMNHYNRKIEINENSFLIHHWSGSWFEQKMKESWIYMKDIF